MLIPVQDITFTQLIQQIEIELLNYTFNERATFGVHLLDENGKSMKIYYIIIEGDDFNVRWVTDDDLVRIICDKLGFIAIFPPKLQRDPTPEIDLMN